MIETHELPDSRLDIKIENLDTRAAVDLTPCGENCFPVVEFMQSATIQIKKDHEKKWRLNLADYFKLKKGRYKFTLTIFVDKVSEAHQAVRLAAPATTFKIL